MRIAISGTPGTGKTEVARALAKLLDADWKVVELNNLAEDKNLYCGYDEKRRCRIVDVDAVAREVGKTKGDFVLESHYAHDVQCDVIIILHCDSTELRERMENKGWDRVKVEENLDAERMSVCLGEAMDSGRPVIEADTTNKGAKEVAREIGLSLKGLDLI